MIQDTEPARARDTARQSPLLTMPGSPHARALRRLGYPENDFAGGGSDRLIDDAFAHGDPEAIATRVREHLDAGADHIVIFPPFGTDAAAQIDQLEQLAPAVVG